MTVNRSDEAVAGGPRDLLEGPVGTLVGTEADEVYLRRRRRAGGPGYVRLRRGDTLIEGDRTVPSPGVDRWLVTAVTPDLVAGRHLRTGRSAAWSRSWLERALATGALSVSLGGFESIRVAGDPGRRGRVRVIAFGDDGRRYERVYGLDTARVTEDRGYETSRGNETSRDGGETTGELRLLRESAAASALDPAMRDALDGLAAGAVRESGYRIRG